MRALITSDWQTRLDNLANCERVADRILHICKEYKLEAVVVAGDLKHHYDPVSLRVIDFWMWFVTELKIIGVKPLLLLGNHDRIGMHEDHKNWLPILQAAGAQTYWEPGRWYAEDGSQLVLFPFISDNQRWLDEAAKLEKWPVNAQNDVLVFHQTVYGARFSKADVMAKTGLPLSALKPERFRYVLGGDIHMHQRIGNNAWYVGSPFPMDWGEVNQQKVFAVILDNELVWAKTGIPGWYDPDVKGFKAPTSWAGTRVRLKVPVSKPEDFIKAKQQAEQLYPGATVTVIPEIIKTEHSVDEDIINLPEHEQIRSFVQNIWPTTLKGAEEEAVAFIEYKLRATGLGYRTDKGVKFTKVWADNVLSFEHVELGFTIPGLRMVIGLNKDWPGRSNGSGKTNLINLISVALFGKTIKGQTHDAWAREGYTGASVIGLEWQTADGDTITVTRSRNPATVQLHINGVDKSSGNRHTDIDKDIQKLCGFSWDMFVALIYISREEQSFLWGTQKQKQEMLARLQNLERFAAAEKLVKKQISDVDDVHTEWTNDLDMVRQSILEKESERTAANELEHFRKRLRENKLQIQAIQPMEPIELLESFQKAERSLTDARTKQMQVGFEITQLEKQLSMFGKSKKCPACGQALKETRLLLGRQELQDKLTKATRTKIDVEREYEKANTVFNAERARYNTAQQQYNLAVARKTQLQEATTQLEDDVAHWEEVLAKHESTLANWRWREQRLETVVAGIQYEMDFLKVIAGILSRTGLPNYLTRVQLPRINKVAEYYSQLFTDGVLQVKFYLDADDNIETEVVNPTGGQRLNGQSSGESGLESLITAFALRGVGVGSNILVLDEPGDGLDEANAKAFAMGMRKIGADLGTVFLITHSQAISSELADIQTVVVEKENGVSRLVS